MTYKISHRGGFKYWKDIILEALESKTELNHLDFKESLSGNTKRWAEHINAFGNTPGGGAFVFGINKHFQCVKRSLPLEEISTKISNLAKDKQEPSLSIDIHLIPIKGQKVLCIHIHEGITSPVFVKDKSPFGGRACFSRNGSQTIAMSVNEIRDRLAQSKDIHADAIPVEGSLIEHLDFRTLSKVIHGIKRSASNESSIGKLRDHQIGCGPDSRFQLTVAGALIFTQEPQKFPSLQDAYIDFKIFRTNSRAEPIKTISITGSLSHQLSTTMDFIKQYIWSVPKINGIKRKDIPAYSADVLREIITNALVHRDYNKKHQPIKIALFKDRLEVENPGGLMPNMTIWNLIHNRSWRNPLIAKYFSKLGYGEMDGQGIDRVCVATQKIKVPAPLFQDQRSTFTVTLSAPKPYEEFTPEEKRLTAITLLMIEGKIDNESLRHIFDIHQVQASTLLKSLIDEGIIQMVGKSKKFCHIQTD